MLQVDMERGGHGGSLRRASPSYVPSSTERCNYVWYVRGSTEVPRNQQQPVSGVYGSM
jgi:hypothetical protein